jgi:predicted TIM-barrel fold metal-dependent hydrolase
VVTEYATFVSWAEVASEMLFDVSAEDREAILGGNAATFYKMK